MIHSICVIVATVGAKWHRFARIRLNPNIIFPQHGTWDSFSGPRTSRGASRNIIYRLLIDIATWAVDIVVEDVERPRGHMVGVDALDGQVMDRGGLGPGLDRVDLDPGAGRGLQPHTRSQIDRVDPRLQVRDPEGVLVGRDDNVPGRHRTRDRSLWTPRATRSPPYGTCSRSSTSTGLWSPSMRCTPRSTPPPRSVPGAPTTSSPSKPTTSTCTPSSRTCRGSTCPRTRCASPGTAAKRPARSRPPRSRHGSPSRARPRSLGSVAPPGARSPRAHPSARASRPST